MFLLLPRLAFGAVAIVDAPSTGSDTGGSVVNVTWSHTVSGANTLLICTAHVSSGGAVTATTGFTFNGNNMLFKAKRDNGAGTPTEYTEIWYQIAPAAGTHTVSLSLNAGANNVVGGCTSFTGVDQTTPLGTAVSNSSDGGIEATPWAITVPTNGMGYGVVTLGGSTAACPSATPNSSGMSAGYDACVGGSANYNATGASATRTTTGNFSWIQEPGAYASAVAVPISPSVGGGGGGTRKPKIVTVL